MDNGCNLNGPSRIVDQIEDPVGASAGGVHRCERWMQRLADAMWIVEQRPSYELEGGDGDFLG